MGTRAVFTFTDENCTACVYVMCDGGPVSAIQQIMASLNYAWALPRFEADEFAAAFIRANKVYPGGYRVVSERDQYTDWEYAYRVYTVEGALHIHVVHFAGREVYTGPIGEYRRED